MKQELQNMKSLLSDLSSAIDEAFENYKPEEPLTLNGKEVNIDYDNDSIDIFGGCYDLQGIKEMIKHVDGLDIENIIKDGIDYYVPGLRDLLTKIEEHENK